MLTLPTSTMLTAGRATIVSIMDTVGDRLKRARMALDISQEMLGQRIGVSRSAIAQVESGISSSLNAENLAKAAQILGRNAVWLASGEGEEYSVEGLGEILRCLPGEDRKEVLNFISYKVARARELHAKQLSADYVSNQLASIEQNFREGNGK